MSMLYFNSFSDFIGMGGHGFYVWLSYALVLLALIGHTLSIRISLTRAKKHVSQYYRRIQKQSHKAS